jgi:uncharacterized Tic20 family protein
VLIAAIPLGIVGIAALGIMIGIVGNILGVILPIVVFLLPVAILLWVILKVCSPTCPDCDKENINVR